MELDEQQNHNEANNKLKNWTKHEKFDLLQALKTIGSHDISAIQGFIPSKTKREVEIAIAYYKDKAFNSPSDKRRTKCNTGGMQKSSLPLANWAKILTDSLSFEELETETATALRLIAELEDIPPAVCTEYVDFRRAYCMLANAMDGKSLQDEKGQSLLINKCLLETALIGKAFIRKSALKTLVRNVNLSDKDVKNFPKHTANGELQTVQHLVSQKNYNPLSITDEFLKASNK